MTRSFQAVALCFWVAITPTLTARGDLLGSTLSWQYYAYGGPYKKPGWNSSGTFVDNGGIGGTFGGLVSGEEWVYFNILADGTSITFDYSVLTGPTDPFLLWSDSGLSLAPTIYNGLAINLVSGPAFSQVTIDPVTNMLGFDTSRFSFTGSQIQVDWANLNFSPGTIVKLDVQTVPEPAMLSLLTLGAGALLLVRRNRNNGLH